MDSGHQDSTRNTNYSFKYFAKKANPLADITAMREKIDNSIGYIIPLPIEVEDRIKRLLEIHRKNYLYFDYETYRKNLNTDET